MYKYRAFWCAQIKRKQERAAPTKRVKAALTYIIHNLNDFCNINICIICAGANAYSEERRKMVKIRVSYKDPAELERVLRLLSPVLWSWKVSGNQEGEYRKAYLELKTVLEADPD